MSAVSSITIHDGKETPVDHTFYPIQTGELTQFRENLSTIPIIGQGVVSIFTKLDSKSGLNKIRVVLELPALETATGQNAAGYTAAPKVGYLNKVSAEFFLPSRGTAAQRKDLRVLLSNLLTDAVVVDSIDNLNMAY